MSDVAKVFFWKETCFFVHKEKYLIQAFHKYQAGDWKKDADKMEGAKIKNNTLNKNFI